MSERLFLAVSCVTVYMPGEEQEEDTTSAASRDLASTVEDLILRALASSNLVGDSEGAGNEETEVSLSVSGDGSTSESQTSIELKDLLGAVCELKFFSKF